MGCHCGQPLQKGEEETKPWENGDFLRWEFVGDLKSKFRLGKAAEPELGCCGTAGDRGSTHLNICMKVLWVLFH